MRARDPDSMRRAADLARREWLKDFLAFLSAAIFFVAVAIVLILMFFG